MAIKQGKFQLATSKEWMERDDSRFMKTFLKIPPNAKFFKMKVGTFKLDVVPYVAGTKNPDAEEGLLTWKVTLWVHRNIGPNQDTVLCPAKMRNKPCPICEERQALLRSEDESDRKEAGNYKPKEWVLVQVRDRNNKEGGLLLFATSFHRFADKIVEMASSGDANDKWENFWHPKGGKALRVKFAEDTAGEGGKYTRAQTVIFEDRQDLNDALIDKGHCLDELTLVYKYDKLKEMFGESKRKEDEEEEDGESESEEGEADEGEEAEEQPKKKKKKPAPEPEEEDASEEGEESESEEESPEEEEPKPKKKKKPAPEPEEDADEESGEEGEESSDEEEESEEPPKKKKKKPAAEPEEDAEEEGEEAPEDEEEAPKPKGKKGKAPAWDDFDKGEPEEGEESESEEEEEPKPKKKKKK